MENRFPGKSVRGVRPLLGLLTPEGPTSTRSHPPLDSPTAWRQEYAYTYLRRLSMPLFQVSMRQGAKTV